jgi:hypothetical protein
MANELAELKLHVRTADQTRRAELALDAKSTGAQIIQAAVDNWKLPADTDYTLVNATTGKALVPTATLAESGVKPGDVLEVQPVLVAGVGDGRHAARSCEGPTYGRWPVRGAPRVSFRSS